jgi:hypothetical protein
MKALRAVVGAFCLCGPGAFGLAQFAGTSAAQQGQGVEFTTFELFEGPDSVDLDPGALERLADAIRGAGAPDRCPVGKLRIRVAEGDPLFQEALLAARRDAALAALDRLVPVAGRLLVETAIFGGSEGHDAVYDFPRDAAPPALRANSTPPKGSRVTPGQAIAVTIAARDGEGPWETGVKTIQLVAESEGGRFIASENFAPCSEPREKRVQATYEVPADPPPIVRLTALAEDHSGHLVQESAEFPTGDFYGTFTYPAGQPPHQHTTQADLVLNHDGRGNLTGTMVGETRWIDASTAPGCFSSMVSPHRFRVALVGAYTEGRSLKVFIGDIQDTPMVLNNRCPTYNTTDEVGHLGFKNYVGLGWYAQQPFLGTPSPLGEGEVLPDGTREYRHTNVTGTMTVTLRRARN